MKKIVSVILSSAICLSLFAQAPKLINYQTIVKDNNGDVMSEQNIALRFTILKGSESGTAVYTEQHLKQTSAMGLVSLKIGEGITSDDMGTINWGGDEYYLKIELDPAAGTDYQVMGTSKIVSVPYALYAENIPDLSVTEAKLADVSITKDKIADEAIDSTKIMNVKRNISLSAGALAETNTSSDVITRVAGGLRWQATYNESALICIKKPDDYAGGDVDLTIFFRAPYVATGVVDFFIRPRSFNTGDNFTDASSINSEGVSVTVSGGFGVVEAQTFVTPADRLEKDWWYITIQRDGDEETFTEDLIVVAVDLEYMAQQ